MNVYKLKARDQVSLLTVKLVRVRMKNGYQMSMIQHNRLRRLNRQWNLQMKTLSIQKIGRLQESKYATVLQLFTY